MTCWQRLSQCLNIPPEESLNPSTTSASAADFLDQSKSGANLNGTFSKTSHPELDGEKCLMSQEPLWALVSPRGIVAMLQLASVVFSQVISSPMFPAVLSAV